MQALAASCEELRARTGNPPLDGNSSSNMNSAIDKGFCLFAMGISSNMAKISLSFESHESGCTSLIHQ